MRILVHDFAGHPFQVQLSRELARRGHTVLHVYFADIPGPKGKLTADDRLPNLTIDPIHVGRPFDPYSYLQRMRAHREYARIVKGKIAEFMPDVFLSGNTPTDAQYSLYRECRRRSIRFVHWVQDFYALALESLLTRRFGRLLGKTSAFPFHVLERQIFKKSDAVVYISDDFAAYAARAGYAATKSVVIENWASLEELPVRVKENGWAKEHQLEDKFVFLYSGTLGLKHNPQTLLKLALKFRAHPDVWVVLVSQGIGRDFLEAAKAEQELVNLLLLNFQPYEALPDVLGSADVLLASVEPDAGDFCVPSKILSYMCSGRAILMSVSAQNLAARIVTKADAGVVAGPGEDHAFVDHAWMLYQDQERCAAMGRNARRYAEATFQINHIGNVFESLLRGDDAMMKQAPTPVAARSSP